jgi:hypothetical protein
MPIPIMQFFAYDHLPEYLGEVSRPFSELADKIVSTLPRNAERTVALRKLLESKDAAVTREASEKVNTPFDALRGAQSPSGVS